MITLSSVSNKSGAIHLTRHACRTIFGSERPTGSIFLYKVDGKSFTHPVRRDLCLHKQRRFVSRNSPCRSRADVNK
jgi:hypothetical protein